MQESQAPWPRAAPLADIHSSNTVAGSERRLPLILTQLYSIFDENARRTYFSEHISANRAIAFGKAEPLGLYFPLQGLRHSHFVSHDRGMRRRRCALLLPLAGEGAETTPHGPGCGLRR
jgi:hypothetical protein